MLKLIQGSAKLTTDTESNSEGVEGHLAVETAYITIKEDGPIYFTYTLDDTELNELEMFWEKDLNGFIQEYCLQDDSTDVIKMLKFHATDELMVWRDFGMNIEDESLKGMTLFFRVRFEG